MRRNRARGIVSVFAWSYAFLKAGWAEIGPDEVGVRFELITGELEAPLYPGIYMVNPVTEQITIYSKKLQQLHVTPEDNLRARTREGQTIFLTAELAYNIDAAKVRVVHIRWQDRYQDDLILPTLRGLIRAVISSYGIADLLKDISAAEEEMFLAMQGRLAEEGFTLDSLEIEVVPPD